MVKNDLPFCPTEHFTYFKFILTIKKDLIDIPSVVMNRVVQIPSYYCSGKDQMIRMDLQLWNTNLSINCFGAEEDKRRCLMKRFLLSDLSNM